MPQYPSHQNYWIELRELHEEAKGLNRQDLGRVLEFTRTLKKIRASENMER